MAIDLRKLAELGPAAMMGESVPGGIDLKEVAQRGSFSDGFNGTGAAAIPAKKRPTPDDWAAINEETRAMQPQRDEEAKGILLSELANYDGPEQNMEALRQEYKNRFGDLPADTPPAAQAPDAGFGNRADGTPKGEGFLGVLPRPDGSVSTEISIGVNLDGRETEIPTLVPTLEPEEVNHLLSGGQPTEQIVGKAVAFARQRMAEGKTLFAQPGEKLNGLSPRLQAAFAMRDEMRRKPEAQEYTSFSDPGSQPVTNISGAEANQPVGGSGIWSDVKNTLNMGWQGVALDAREIAKKGLGDGFVAFVDNIDEILSGKKSEQLINEKIEASRQALTPEMAAALEKDWWDENTNSPGEALKDPRAILGGLTQSLPGTAITMIPGLALAKGMYGVRMAAAADAATAGGLTGEAAKQFLRQQATVEAARAATAAQVAGSVLEGTQGGAQASREVFDAILKMDAATLKDSDAMRAMMSQGMSFEEARKALATDASSQAMLTAGFVTGIFGGMGDRIMAQAAISGIKGGIAARIAKGVVSEGLLEEFPQSYGSRVAQNVAMQQADPSIPTTKGALNEGVGGLAIGGVMGGAMAAPFKDRSPEEQAAAPARKADSPLTNAAAKLTQAPAAAPASGDTPLSGALPIPPEPAVGGPALGWGGYADIVPLGDKTYDEAVQTLSTFFGDFQNEQALRKLGGVPADVIDQARHVWANIINNPEAQPGMRRQAIQQAFDLMNRVKGFGSNVGESRLGSNFTMSPGEQAGPSAFDPQGRAQIADQTGGAGEVFAGAGGIEERRPALPGVNEDGTPWHEQNPEARALAQAMKDGSLDARDTGTGGVPPMPAPKVTEAQRRAKIFDIKQKIASGWVVGDGLTLNNPATGKSIAITASEKITAKKEAKNGTAAGKPASKNAAPSAKGGKARGDVVPGGPAVAGADGNEQPTPGRDPAAEDPASGSEPAVPAGAADARPPVTEEGRLAAKRAAYQLLKSTGAPDDVVASGIVGYQEKANERGEPMNLWAADGGTIGLVPASQKSPFKSGRLIATIHPEQSAQGKTESVAAPDSPLPEGWTSAGGSIYTNPAAPGVSIKVEPSVGSGRQIFSVKADFKSPGDQRGEAIGTTADATDAVYRAEAASEIQAKQRKQKAAAEEKTRADAELTAKRDREAKEQAAAKAREEEARAAQQKAEEGPVSINDVPPKLMKKIQVPVERMVGDSIQTVEVSANEALADLDEEISAYEKLLACVKGAA